jgi:hypothetical protein
MVIDDFHVPCRAFSPDETHAPLVVYADAPLAFTVALEGFQPVLSNNSIFVAAINSS